MTERDKELSGRGEDLWVEKCHFLHATASDGARRNRASGFQIPNVLSLAIPSPVSSSLPPVKLSLEAWVTAFKQLHLSPPNQKFPHARRWASLSHWWGERNTVVQGHTTAVFFLNPNQYQWVLLHQRCLDGAGLLAYRHQCRWKHQKASLHPPRHRALPTALQHDTVKLAFV